MPLAACVHTSSAKFAGWHWQSQAQRKAGFAAIYANPLVGQALQSSQRTVQQLATESTRGVIMLTNAQAHRIKPVCLHDCCAHRTAARSETPPQSTTLWTSFKRSVTTQQLAQPFNGFALEVQSSTHIDTDQANLASMTVTNWYPILPQ
jgi:hypothetical protein